MAKSGSLCVETPSYLSGSLKTRFEAVAPQLVAAGVLCDSNRDVLAKYVLAENEYLLVSNYVQNAIKAGDSDGANKWLSAQDRLIKQTMTLGHELGLTPTGRQLRGLPVF